MNKFAQFDAQHQAHLQHIGANGAAAAASTPAAAGKKQA